MDSPIFDDDLVRLVTWPPYRIKGNIKHKTHEPSEYWKTMVLEKCEFENVMARLIDGACPQVKAARMPEGRYHVHISAPPNTRTEFEKDDVTS